MPDHYCDKCGEVDYECICDQEYARIHQLEAEIERLRTLIRCEQIEPPADATDDQTTELAVDLAEAKAEIDRLRAALREACDYAVSGDYPDILDAEDFMARLLEDAEPCKPQSD